MKTNTTKYTNTKNQINNVSYKKKNDNMVMKAAYGQVNNAPENVKLKQRQHNATS